MTEKELETALVDLINNYADCFISDAGEELFALRTASFEDDRMMTRNRGLTVEFEDGSEFQITIMKRR